MIQARHTFLGARVCSFYSGYMLQKAFKEILFYGETSSGGLPILMLSNHFSWWDGFIQYRLNKRMFKKEFHVMMLEEQLSKYMILNKGGAFSIKKHSREVIESLNYCTRLLENPNNLVLLFPQGKIESLYTEKVRFGNGLYYLLERNKNPFQLVFNVNLVDYFSDRKPTLSIYFKSYAFSSNDNHTLEKAFNDFYNECKTHQIHRNDAG